MNERYIKWYTPYLSRDFEMLAFGEGGGLPLILFPTSFGSYYQNKDFGLVGAVVGMLMPARSQFTARTRSISKAFTTKRFTRLIECGHTTPMKM